MEKKLPKIYKGENYSHVNNNKKVFSFDSSKKEDININNNFSFEKDYLINMPVIIETNNKTITCKIVSKVGDHIMTSKNQIIKLDDIKSIKKI